MDFMHDAIATGEKLRVLTVIDLFTREALAVDARRSYSAADVVAVLDRLGSQHGLPQIIQCDQGTEFTSMALDHWAYWNKVRLDFSRPGKPGDNALNEAFNGTVRRECLSQHYFLSLEEAKRTLEAWRLDYNNHRPHSSLDQMPPARYRAAWQSNQVRSRPKTGGAFGLRLG